VFLVSTVILAVRQPHAIDIVWILVFTPALIGLFSLAMIPAVLMYGLVAGVPGVSLLYGFQAAKRNWRGVLGGLLLASAVIAAAYAAFNIR